MLMETEGDGGEGSNEIMLGTEERFEFDVDVASGVTSDHAVARSATLMLYKTFCKICISIYMQLLLKAMAPCSYAKEICCDALCAAPKF